MSAVGQFATPAYWVAGAHLAKVTDVPDAHGHIEIQLLGPDPDGDAPIRALVATGFAGNNYGAFLIPDKDEIVLVVFAGQDARHPVVVGSVWTGANSAPETVGGKNVDRWTLTGKNGTRIAIVEQSAGTETVEISTPGGATATLTDQSGGKIELVVGTNRLTMDTSGVTIDTQGTCTVNASELSVTAGTVSVSSGFSSFSGVVQCDTLIANSVVSTSYTPGAGNVW